MKYKLHHQLMTTHLFQKTLSGALQTTDMLFKILTSSHHMKLLYSHCKMKTWILDQDTSIKLQNSGTFSTLVLRCHAARPLPVTSSTPPFCWRQLMGPKCRAMERNSCRLILVEKHITKLFTSQTHRKTSLEWTSFTRIELIFAGVSLEITISMTLELKFGAYWNL